MSDSKLYKSSTPAADEVLSKPKHVPVTDDQDGQRVDNFLIRHCQGVPRSHLYRLIRQGAVLVNGRRVKQTRKLVAGEQVRIPAVSLKPAADVKVPESLATEVGNSIIQETEDFLVVNKPQGLAVHGGSGLAFGLIDALRQARGEPNLELAHRLDRATSGALLIGRGMKATRLLQDLFRQRSIEKRYIALVDGRWPANLHKIDVPLMKNVEHAGERRVVVDPQGQSAVTLFKVRSRLVDATLLDVTLETGRTHQIRVHSRHAGHAVVGDTRYGDNKRNATFKKNGLARLYLHSSELAFEWKERKVRVRAPTDQYWEDAIESINVDGREPKVERHKNNGLEKW